MMTDSELVAKILARDRRALYTFYTTYTPKLRKFIYSRVDNSDDREEILQDALFAFLEAIRDFRGSAKLQTFLFSITTHKIIDYYRRKKIRHTVFSRLSYFEGLISPLDVPEEALDRTLLTEKIHVVFGKILPRYRSILVWKYIEGHSVQSIALQLKITFKSAESLLFRARKAFVKAFISI